MIATFAVCARAVSRHEGRDRGEFYRIDFASCSTRIVLKLKHQPRCSPIRTGGRLLSDGTMAKSLGPDGHAGAAARAQSKRGKSHVGVLAAAAAAAARRSGGMNALSLPLSLPPSFSISLRLSPRHPGRSPPLCARDEVHRESKESCVSMSAGVACWPASILSLEYAVQQQDS